MLKVSSSPHSRSKDSTTYIMLDVIIALIPAFVMSVIYFGFHALLLSAVCVLSAVLSEYLCRKAMKRENTLGDLSAVVTGLLLAFCLPSTLPLWMGALGSVIAIVVVKQMFGGIGQNFVNPALTARIILMSCFAGEMTNWAVPFTRSFLHAQTTATPLVEIAKGYMAVNSYKAGDLPKMTHLLFGIHGGSMGEVCALALIAGGIYLMIRRVISPIIPLCFIGSAYVFVILFGQVDLIYGIYTVFSGGLLLGAIFMATDYTTSPITKWGKVIYGIGCGLITAVIRVYGSLPEGVSYAIILMNIFVPHIESLTRPKPFGYVKEKKNKKTETEANKA